MDDGWSIAETQFRTGANRAHEGPLAQPSGYLHVRGSHEEHPAGAPRDAAPLRRPANVTAEAFPPERAGE